MTALNLNVGRSSFDRDMPDFDVEESENLAALGMHVTGGAKPDEDEEDEEGVEKELAKTEVVEKVEPDEKEKELEEVNELEELDRLEAEFRKEDAPTLEDVEE